MLVNHADPVLYGIIGRAYPDFPTLDKNTSFIRFLQSKQHFHQGGLAGAVLAYKGMDFPFAYFKSDV